ncbi:hypothetical protein [Bradyrhizobium phage ppBeUSDA76-2]|uniref:hypothetical protein n=1 Tax=Bradyrhizobium elkanii TaxID=29448 RepID=UPI00036EB1C3|nr:hypothetical protein [Bradyrhizobium elkanii]WAX24392.1 hypothetical protein [Bradyrhizobium phage ppBeUSDA76-2]MCP1732453.1 hypothetical protein [Bradyrhizobium elkanii]MCS3567791.1 hypothetical protein [Bradyrhizobium elkanii]MCS3590726.1 hypothetical protein [Bradyrhizobium elkanii]MCS3620169.1 hypothetical protein [Bradyrhizobium elkanii]
MAQQHSYYVVMCDFGRLGLEAIVKPEITRRNVIDRIKAGEYQLIQFIHHIADGLVEVVTDELIDEAEAELRAEHIASRADRLANTQDHNRKLVREAV